MKTWLDQAPALRAERHFGDRVLQCFAARPRGLTQMLEEAVARNGAGEALVCGETRLTWRALESRVARAAGALAQRGIGAGDRVGVLLGNRIEFPLAVLAAARLGAIPVPIGIREQKPGLEYILRHCGAALLVHEAALAERVPDFLPWRVTAEEFLDFSFLGSSNEDAVAQASPSGEDEVATILYTSRTTGRPKGAMLSNLGIVHSALNFELCMEMS